MNEGFFISPDGVIITLEVTHIATVIRQPDKFGLTRLAIDECYRSHREPIGLEGDAREQILVGLISSGWSRVRNYRGAWSMQVSSRSRSLMRVLVQFGRMALAGRQPFYGKAPATDIVNLTAMDTGERTIMTMQELANGAGYSGGGGLLFISIDDYVPRSDIENKANAEA